MSVGTAVTIKGESGRIAKIWQCGDHLRYMVEMSDGCPLILCCCELAKIVKGV